MVVQHAPFVKCRYLHPGSWPGSTLGSKVFGPGGVAVAPGDPPVAAPGVAAASLRAGPGPSYALPVGAYPPFLRFPAFVVDFQLKERQRIVAEEASLQSRKRVAQELARRKCVDVLACVCALVPLLYCFGGLWHPPPPPEYVRQQSLA